MFLCFYVFMFLCFYVFTFLRFYVFTFLRFYVFTFLRFYVFKFLRFYVFKFLRFYVFAFLHLSLEPKSLSLEPKSSSNFDHWQTDRLTDERNPTLLGLDSTRLIFRHPLHVSPFAHRLYHRLYHQNFWIEFYPPPPYGQCQKRRCFFLGDPP